MKKKLADLNFSEEQARWLEDFLRGLAAHQGTVKAAFDAWFVTKSILDCQVLASRVRVVLSEQTDRLDDVLVSVTEYLKALQARKDDAILARTLAEKDFERERDQEN